MRRGTSPTGALLIGLATFVCLATTSAFQLPAVTVPNRARQVSRGLESAHPLPLRRPSPTALSGGAAVDGDGKSAELPLSIYIEHTDRYQVVYNANYVKFLVRAIRHAWPLGDSVLVGMSNVRFKAPARLGDHVIIHTKHIDTQPLKDSGRALSSFVQEICCQEDPKRVFFSADLTLAHALTSPLPTTTAQEAQPSPDMIEVANAPLVSFSTHVWADEMDHGGRGGVPAPHHVLAYFERARTNALGGPGKLESLVAEEGVMFVVAKIDTYWFDASHKGLCDGEEVRVGGRFKARGSAIIECQQVLVDGSGSILAHASVTLACLDATTNRMSKVPPNVLTLLAVAPPAA